MVFQAKFCCTKFLPRGKLKSLTLSWPTCQTSPPLSVGNAECCALFQFSKNLLVSAALQTLLEEMRFAC